MALNVLTVAQAIGQINPLLGAAISIIQTVRAIRASAVIDPADPDGALPSDAELIERFLTEAGLLKAEAHELREWLKTQG